MVLKIRINQCLVNFQRKTENDLSGRIAIMPKSKKRKVFISYSSEDSTLAGTIGNLFKKEVNVEKFLYEESIDPLSEWKPQIRNNINNCELLIVLMTPSSRNSVWVHFETGAAWIKSIKILTLCAKGLRPSMWPTLNQLNAIQIDSVKGVRKLLNVLINEKFIRKKVNNSIIKRIASEGRMKGNWEFVRIAEVADKLGGSPFVLSEMINYAEKSIFVVGQNLSFMAKEAQIHESIRKWLEAKAGRKIELLICDPCSHSAILQYSIIFDKTKFIEDLYDAIKVFKKLQKKLGRRKFKVKLAKSVPLSLTITDGSLPSGRMSITPIVFTPVSEERPVFMIKRKTNETVFSHYYNNYYERFRYSKRNVDNVTNKEIKECNKLMSHPELSSIIRKEKSKTK